MMLEYIQPYIVRRYGATYIFGEMIGLLNIVKA